MRMPALLLLRLRIVGLLFLVVTQGPVFASSRSNNEMILLERVSFLMEQFREEHGRRPANWAEIKQAPSGLEEMLTTFEKAKHYRFEDRYVFPNKPMRASMEITGYRQGPVLLLRTIPLARAERPFRLIRMVLMEYSARDRFGTQPGIRIGRVQLTEDQFQKLLIENDMSLPSPAGAPAFESDYNESIFGARWWPLMALAAIIFSWFAFTRFLKPQSGGWPSKSAKGMVCPTCSVSVSIRVVSGSHFSFQD
jgi:hypothetical protein